MRKTRATKLIAKDPNAATNALGEAWTAIRTARQWMDRAHAAIGDNTRWAGQLALTHKALHKTSLWLEEIVDEIKTVERERRAAEKGQC